MIRRCSLIIAACAICAGCGGPQQSDTPARPKPTPVADLPPPPPGSVPARITLAAEVPVDTNSNGVADSVGVFVYLWTDPVRSGYPLPIWADGSMMFTMTSREGEELARWNMPGVVVEASRTRLAPGPAYFFNLSLVEAGGEDFQPQPVDLHARFTTPTGDTAKSYSPASFDRLGR